MATWTPPSSSSGPPRPSTPATPSSRSRPPSSSRPWLGGRRPARPSAAPPPATAHVPSPSTPPPRPPGSAARSRVPDVHRSPPRRAAPAPRRPSPRRLAGAGPLHLLGGLVRPLPLSGPGGGDPGAAGGAPRGALHAHRVGQVDGGQLPPLPGHGPWRALLLHLPDQGAREREVLRPVPPLRPGERGNDDRGRRREPRRAHRLLHRRDPDERGAPRGEPPGGRGGDGRVPLLRRPGARRGLAGAAAPARQGPLPPHVGD